MSFGFGIVGLGLIANFHAQAIQALKKGKLVACTSQFPQEVASFSQKYQCRGYEDIKEFLKHPGLDIVSICTPSGLHLDAALEAAEAGKAVIIEKPLEISLERCDRIIEACARKKVLLAGVFQSRFSPLSGLIKKTLQEGRFGRLVLGDAYVKWFRSQEYYDKGGWHGTWKLDGGGALMNQSIHAIDLLQWYMGAVDSISAFAATLGHERIEVEDAAVATLQFKSGALGVIEGTTAIYPGFLKRLEISGTRGSAIQEEEILRAWSFAEERDEDRGIRERYAVKTTKGGGASDPGAIDSEGHRRQFQDLIEALEQGREPLVNGTEARKSVEIIVGIYRGVREGKRVTLPLS